MSGPAAVHCDLSSRTATAWIRHCPETFWPGGSFLEPVCTRPAGTPSRPAASAVVNIVSPRLSRLTNCSGGTPKARENKRMVSAYGALLPFPAGRSLRGSPGRGRELKLAQPCGLAEGAQSLPGPAGLPPPGGDHVPDVGDKLRFREVIRSHVTPVTDADRWEAPPPQPATDGRERDVRASGPPRSGTTAPGAASSRPHCFLGVNIDCVHACPRLCQTRWHLRRACSRTPAIMA